MGSGQDTTFDVNHPMTVRANRRTFLHFPLKPGHFPQSRCDRNCKDLTGGIKNNATRSRWNQAKPQPSNKLIVLHLTMRFFCCARRVMERITDADQGAHWRPKQRVTIPLQTVLTNNRLHRAGTRLFLLQQARIPSPRAGFSTWPRCQAAPISGSIRGHRNSNSRRCARRYRFMQQAARRA